jgi:hypothetical protein
MKLKFVINQKFEEQIIKNKEVALLRGYTDKDLKSLDDKYKKSLKYLKLTQKMYQKSWDEINDRFSKFVEKITGQKWAYSNYECIISMIEPGWVNLKRNSNKVMRWWKDSPYFMRRITAHELFEGYCCHQIYHKYYKDSGLTEGQIWALSELAAYTLTSIPKEVEEFWPWSTSYMGSYYPHTGYPQLEKIKGRFKQLFLSSNSFDDYIKKGIKEIKKYPKINPVSKDLK